MMPPKHNLNNCKSAILLPYYQLSSEITVDRGQNTARENEQKQISGPDGIHLRVLCEVKDERAELLISVCNH